MYIVKMPSLGLIFTSIGFILPAWIAKKRKQKKNTLLISSLTTTSLLYHGTMHPYAHAVDTVVAHMVAIHYFFMGIKNTIKYKQKLDVIGLLFGFLSTHMYYKKSLPTKDERKSRKWHMKVHLSAQAALLAFVLASSPRPSGSRRYLRLL